GPGADPEPAADRGRRAGLRAGRVGPGPGAEPHADAAGTARAQLRGDLARPVGNPVPGERDRGHVPRQGGRGRTGPRPVRADSASLYAGPDRRDPAPRSGPGPQPRPDRRDGRTAVGYQPAVGVPVPDAMPAGAGDLRGRGAAEAAGYSRAARNGPVIAVSGTTCRPEVIGDGTKAQAADCLRRLVSAVEQLG